MALFKTATAPTEPPPSAPVDLEAQLRQLDAEAASRRASLQAQIETKRRTDEEAAKEAAIVAKGEAVVRARAAYEAAKAELEEQNAEVLRSVVAATIAHSRASIAFEKGVEAWRTLKTAEVLVQHGLPGAVLPEPREIARAMPTAWSWSEGGNVHIGRCRQLR